MILFHQHSSIHFHSFGIAIPQAGSRASRVVEALLADPGLAHGRWLMRIDPAPPTRDDLLLVHSEEYVDLLLSEDPSPAVLPAYELVGEDGAFHRYAPDRAAEPLRGLVDKALANAAGTLLACETALKTGFAHFLGGGMHHAMHGAGRGFCLVNDLVLAVRCLRRDGRINRAWIVDVDAHRGDGTAELCLDDPLTRTLSVHMANGWPLDGPALDKMGNLDRARYPSDVDVAVAEDAQDRYLSMTRSGMELLRDLDQGRPPDLVLVVGGADPYEHDELESARPLRLSLQAMAERDLFLYHWLRELGAPQAWLMSGGYGERSHEVYVEFLSRIAPGLG